ncbi:hypothetical protein AVEN_26178-1, partial [Araneus ventricosus]
MVQKGAFKTLKKKPKKLAKKFSFWNEDLCLTRNKVNKLFKIYRKHKAENSNVDLIQSSGNAYRRERAVFKKLLLKTKRKAWEDFCVNYNDRYGSLFKLVFNKSTGENSIGVSPNNDPNNSIVDRITHIMDFFFPGKSADDNFVFHPIVGPISSLTIEDLEITFGNLKCGKAPGLYRIDYRMWRVVFITDKIFMLDLFNRCFILNYFPRCLRNARVFFLLKDGKDPGLCNSYRPVCLLPTLGKVVERLFLIKLNGWLDQHNIIHDNQYGFREGRSCDLAIHTLVETMKFKMNTDHLALVSLDIKSTFGNMNCHNSVFQAELAAIHCAANWAASKNVSINIHTDSLSSIAAIKSASARSSFVNNIKQDLVKIEHLVGLSWVKVHVGIQGNELADQQAKLATTTGVDTIIPAPRSYVKRILNKLMIKEWNDYWRQYNSTSGARVREYLEQ